MELRFLHAVRTALAAASLAAVALLAPATSAGAAPEATDGWQHSIIGQQNGTSQGVTDGWLNSHVTDGLEPPRPTTDGWMTSVETLGGQDDDRIAAVTDGWMTSLDVSEGHGSRSTATVTDGWLTSIVAQQARDFDGTRGIPESAQARSSYGYIDEFAVTSGILNLVLVTGCVAIFLRRRQASSVA